VASRSTTTCSYYLYNQSKPFAPVSVFFIMEKTVKLLQLSLNINDKRFPTTHGGGTLEAARIELASCFALIITSTCLSGKARMRKVGLEPTSGSDSGTCLPIGTYSVNTASLSSLSPSERGRSRTYFWTIRATKHSYTVPSANVVATKAFPTRRSLVAVFLF
jgi:hypothetical protein